MIAMTSGLTDLRVVDFLDELASDKPAPGGGSVAALAGALAAALSSMVCNLTIGKNDYESVQADMIRIREYSEDLRRNLTELVDKDTESFNAVISALKMPKDTEEQRERRKEALQRSYKAAALIPLDTARSCLRVLDAARITAEKGNRSSITDAAVSAIMAKAGLESAVLNVKVNLSYIKDAALVDNIQKEIDDLQGRAARETTEILRLVEQVLKSKK